MKITPPLVIGNVEVTSIHKDIKSIHLIVHFKESDVENEESDVHNFAMTSVTNACRYLEGEGFIEGELSTWLTHVSCIKHSHQ